jgi:hypothetical protein
MAKHHFNGTRRMVKKEERFGRIIGIIVFAKRVIIGLVLIISITIP